MQIIWQIVNVHQHGDGELRTDHFVRPTVWSKFIFVEELKDESGTVKQAKISWMDEDPAGSASISVQDPA